MSSVEAADGSTFGGCAGSCRHAASTCDYGLYETTLLLRHESFVVSSRREAESMTDRIAALEAENARLHAQNISLAGENKDLVSHVSELNDAVISSDATIAALNATLEDTHVEMERLRKLAARADDLDAELSAMELDKLALEDALASTDAEKKEADRKWAASQRALESLQAQMEIVELDAAEERRRHTALARKMDAQASERKTIESHQRQARVRERAVSDAVKDLVAETTKVKQQNLELQSALEGARDEVEYLKNELARYREDEAMRIATDSPSLEDELRGCRPPHSNRISFAPSQTSTLIEEMAVGSESPRSYGITGSMRHVDKMLAGLNVSEKAAVTSALSSLGGGGVGGNGLAVGLAGARNLNLNLRAPRLPLREEVWKGAVLTEATIHAPKARQPSRSGVAALQGLLGR